MTRAVQPVLILLLVLIASPFALYAVRLGLAGLAGAPVGPGHLFQPDAPLTTLAVHLHMVAGAWLTMGAPLQLLRPIRRRWPALHRWNGRLVIAFGLVTALAGLAYIASRGTVGGWVMDLGFGVYGLLTAWAAVQTVRFARLRDFDRHRAWALRLFVLAIASWLYRVHYGLWEIATGGMWREEDFSGLFDRVTIFAFYLPYLALVEVWLWWRPRVAA